MSTEAGGVTIAMMAERLTPRQAARVKYQALIFAAMDPSPRIDELLANNAGHRWFCFCLDAVARLEGSDA